MIIRVLFPTGIPGILIALLFFCINANCQTSIYFKTGSDHIDAQGQEAIKKIAASVAGKDVALIVRGFTDTTGTALQNLALARKREAAVAAILTENGIDIAHIGYSCHENLPNEKLPDAENRRVSVTLHELAAYTAKNGSVIIAPKDLKLRLIDKFDQPSLIQNYYRNKDCMLPVHPGRWLTDVAIESATDSCNFMIIKIPDRDGDYLPTIFLADSKSVSGRKESFRNYATQDRYKLFRVPLYSNYIAFDQYVGCGYTPTVYLKIILPKRIHPIRAQLADACITRAATFRKDTLRTDFHEYARVDWRSLTLAVKTRDTLYQAPMSAFDIIHESDYGAGTYVLRLRDDSKYFQKRQAAVKKRRTFWQRLLDLFR